MTEEAEIQEKASELLDAFERAFVVLDIGRVVPWLEQRRLSPDVVRLARANGVSLVLLLPEWSARNVRLSLEIRPSWKLSTHIELEIDAFVPPHTRHREVLAHVSWGSESGDVGDAVARAAHHLEWAQRAAQAKMVLERPLASVAEAYACQVFEIIQARQEVIRALVREGLKAEERQASYIVANTIGAGACCDQCGVELAPWAAEPATCAGCSNE